MIYIVTGSNGTCGSTESYGNNTAYSDYIKSENILGNTIKIIQEKYYRKKYEIPKLLYKNWLTLKEWLMELHIARIYCSLKGNTGIIYNNYFRKTVKSLSPIIRNHCRGRE